MKDRIRNVMEMQHMTQQIFAGFIGMSPATLSSILTGRTNPTLQIVTAIKNKIPNISTDWLMFGTGEMFLSDANNTSTPPSASANGNSAEPMLNFGNSETTPEVYSAPPAYRPTLQKEKVELVKNIDNHQRKITEIRIFYDDQTWETFLPKR